MNSRRWISWCAFLLVSLPALAGAVEPGHHLDRAGATGVSALWILANFSYAGMRAQAHPDQFWRILSFLAGLPGTFLTWIVVKEGGERAYGVDLPKKRP